MSKNSQTSFPIAAIFLTIAICALFFSRGMSFWFLLLVTILIAIFVCVELLTRGIPANLRHLSHANCYRMDGSRSHRRSLREQRALWRIRSDLWAIFLIVAFVGASGVFVLHNVFPINLVDDVVAAARDNSGDFKLALRKQGVDDEFFRWARSTSRSTNSEIRQRQEWLWMAWPVIVGLALATFAGCLVLVRFAYFRALREFAAGVKARSAEYLNLDIGRLQG